MYLAYENAIMPYIEKTQLDKLMTNIRGNIFTRAQANYRGLVVTIFQGLYVYQQLGINITPYTEVAEAAQNGKRNVQELVQMAHEIARELCRRPSTPFKEVETEFKVAVTFLPTDNNQMIVMSKVVYEELESILRAALIDEGATRYVLDAPYQEYGPEDGAMVYSLIDFDGDIASITLTQDYIQMLCLPEGTLAYMAAEKKTEIEKFGDYIKALNESGTLINESNAYEVCSEALNFSQRFLEKHAEEIRTLSLEYMKKLNNEALFAG